MRTFSSRVVIRVGTSQHFFGVNVELNVLIHHLPYPMVRYGVPYRTPPYRTVPDPTLPYLGARFRERRLELHAIPNEVYGDCLFNAVAMALWGLHDRNNVSRDKASSNQNQYS